MPLHFLLAANLYKAVASLRSTRLRPSSLVTLTAQGDAVPLIHPLLKGRGPFRIPILRLRRLLFFDLKIKLPFTGTAACFICGQISKKSDKFLADAVKTAVCETKIHFPV